MSGGYVRVWGRWYSVGGGFHERFYIVSMHCPPFPRRGEVSNFEDILNSNNNKGALPSRLQLGRGGEDTDRDFVTDCIWVNCRGFDVGIFECP